jgi:predicted TIM-barrel fold metal-dependent hydrolase
MHIIDFRGRPPTPAFLSYFGPDRLRWIAERVGARSISRAYQEKSLDLFFAEMDEAGIEYTVALGRNSPELMVGKRRFPAGIIPNDHVLDLQTRYPGRVIGMAGVDVSNRLHNAVDEIDDYVGKRGLKGVFIEPQRAIPGHPSDPVCFPVYEKCVELGVPVSIMTGPFAGPDLSYTAPVHIDIVASEFPDLKIIAGHGAWPYVNEIISVAFRHPNVYVSPDVYHFTPGSAAYVEAANGFMADQLLFGTAYPIRPLRQTVEDFSRLGLKPDSLEKALFKNGRALLGLGPR